MATGILDRAASMLGMNERTQRAALMDYLKTGGVNLDPATQAWCAAFVNSTLKQSGIDGTGSNMARSFLKYGTSVDTPQPGDLAVFSRGDPNGPYGHVGFFQGLSEDGKSVKVLGGNQGNAVSVKEYPLARLLGYRRPPGPQATGADPQIAAADQAAPMGTAMGGFSAGPTQVAQRQPTGVMPNIQPAMAPGTTADFRPSSFQQLAARQAMEGDPSQRMRLLEAAGLDPTGQKRLNPRGMNNPGILSLLQGKRGAAPTIQPAGAGGGMGGVLGKIFGLFG